MNRPAILARFIFILCLLPLGYITLIGGGTITGALFLSQAITFALGTCVFGGWLIGRGVIRRARWPSTGLEWPLALAALAGGLSLLASPQWRPGLARLAELAAYAALFYLTGDLLMAGLPRSVLVHALITVSGLALFVGLLEVYVYYQGRWPALLAYSLYRVVGLPGHANLLAGLAGMVLPLVIWVWRNNRRVWVRSALLLWGACYFILLPFLSSRGGLLGLGVMGAGMIGWVVARRGAARSLVEAPRGHGWLIGGGAGAGLAILAGLFIYQSQHPSHGGALSARVYIWSAAARVIASHLWLGTGPGRFGEEVARVVSVPTEFWPLHAHSVFWQAFAEFGLPGLLALMALAAGAAVTIRRRLRAATPDEQLWLALLSAALAGYAAQNLVDDQTHVLATMIPFVLVMALALTPSPDAAVRARVPLMALAVPLIAIAILQAQWLWAYAAFDRALTAYGAGERASALSWVQQAARHDPALPFYEVEAGLLAAELDDWRAAQSHFERALVREDSLAFVWINLSVARLNNGDPSGAFAASQRAAQLAPRSPTIRITAGQMAECVGQFQIAEDHYRAALAARPDWADRPFWDQTEPRTNARAAAPLENSEPVDPYPALRSQLESGRVAEARDAIASRLADPDLLPRWRAGLLFLLGDAHLAEGDEPEAMQQYAESLILLAHPSIAGTGEAFWTVYGYWLHQRQPLPLDAAPGLLPLDARPEMLTRFEQLSAWTRAQGDYVGAQFIDHQRQRLDPAALITPCP